MKDIKMIVDKIQCELNGSEEYISCAAKSKADGDMDSMVEYSKIADSKLSNAMSLHTLATKKITKFRADNPSYEPHEFMKEMWEDLHKTLIKKASEIKYSIDIMKK